MLTVYFVLFASLFLVGAFARPVDVKTLLTADNDDLVKLSGSAPPPLSEMGSAWLIPIDVNELIDVHIYVRRNNEEKFDLELEAIINGTAPCLTVEQYGESYGSTSADLSAVVAFASAHELLIVEQSSTKHLIAVRGRISDINAAFSVNVQKYGSDLGPYYSHEGELSFPASLSSIITGVMGLHTPPASPHFHLRELNSSMAYYWPSQVAAWYLFPSGAKGSPSNNVGIIELGGGYYASDLTTYWANAGVSPAPVVTSIGVNGGTNSPGNINLDGEVNLDIEIVGALASAAHVLVYFAPNNLAYYANAVNTAATDAVNRPSAITTSWGLAENYWDTADKTSLNSILATAASLGVSFFAASGDRGSSDGYSGNNVDFPAASPYATGCGGTSLRSATTEVVWNNSPTSSASGGGYSPSRALPSWQTGRKLTTASGATSNLVNRGVPDVAASADPNYGWLIYLHGGYYAFGGTSAAAPLWAALVAIQSTLHSNQRWGLINPKIYASTQTGMKDILPPGNNGNWGVSTGWDAATGIGAPRNPSLV